MEIEIARERPDSPEARLLIEELDAYLIPMYPPESHHGYAVEKLIREGVAFFVARRDGAPLACGGVQLYGREYGEVKRMYVRPSSRGLGLGKRMLAQIAGYTREQGVPLLRLETGIYQHEAIGLYEKIGFTRISPFGEYGQDPLSVYFEKRLA